MFDQFDSIAGEQWANQSLRGGARNKSRYSILIRNAARSFREILLKMFEKYSSGEPISPSKGGPGTKAHTPFIVYKKGGDFDFLHILQQT